MLLTERTQTVHVMNAVAAGTSNQTSSSVDMSQNGGYRGCRFIADIGTLTASQVTSMKVQGSPDNSDWTTLGGDLAGTGTGNMADADSNKTLIVDIYRPKFRYLRAIVVRGTANAVINCVLAELYEPITEPTTQDATTSKSKQLITPALGTA
jgi:hypothetical protein